MFEFIKAITLRTTYECQSSGSLPGYMGSTIRGILGHCIRDFYCQSFSRYSMNQKSGKLELPSKTGWILYLGDISRFIPIWM